MEVALARKPLTHELMLDVTWRPLVLTGWRVNNELRIGMPSITYTLLHRPCRELPQRRSRRESSRPSLRSWWFLLAACGICSSPSQAELQWRPWHNPLVNRSPLSWRFLPTCHRPIDRSASVWCFATWSHLGTQRYRLPDPEHVGSALGYLEINYLPSPRLRTLCLLPGYRTILTRPS